MCWPRRCPDQGPLLVIEEEHPLQIRLRRRAREPHVRGRRIISQELHRHTPQSRTDPPVIHPQRSNRYKIRTPPTPAYIGTAGGDSALPDGSLTPLAVRLLLKSRVQNVPRSGWARGETPISPAERMMIALRRMAQESMSAQRFGSSEAG
jgi:hypothetical protein